MAEKEKKRTEGLPEPPAEIVVAEVKPKIDFKRIFFILLGLALFFGIYFSPPWPDAVDPLGKH
ncbi:MAG: SLC13/DASS family transporter, partial [Nitrospirota bacterium]